jgi:hypothetical protein
VSADSVTPRDGGPSASGEGSSLDLAPPPAPALSQSRNLPARFGFRRWILRVGMLLFVSMCAVFGVLLVILPWTPKWTDSYILISYPAVRGLLENGFVRGMCTGLGALDIWIGFWEAMHYHENEARSGSTDSHSANF